VLRSCTIASELNFAPSASNKIIRRGRGIPMGIRGKKAIVVRIRMDIFFELDFTCLSIR